MVIDAYTPEHFDTLADWHRARHFSELSPEILPPLGFVVSDENGLLAALFCYQSYGVGVAFIDVALSRPGLSFASAKEAFSMCIAAIILACADTHKLFRIHSGELAITRVLISLGFKRMIQGRGDNLFLISQ